MELPFYPRADRSSLVAKGRVIREHRLFGHIDRSYGVSEDLSAGKPYLIIGSYAANCISLGTSWLLKSSSNCRDTDPKPFGGGCRGPDLHQLEPSRFAAEATRVFTSIRRLLLPYHPSLPQQSHRSPLTRAAKQQRVSQGRALNDLTRPLVVPRKLRAHREVCTALDQ